MIQCQRRQMKFLLCEESACRDGITCFLDFALNGLLKLSVRPYSAALRLPFTAFFY